MEDKELDVIPVEDLSETNFEKFIRKSTKVEEVLPGDRYDYAKLALVAGATYAGSKALNDYLERKSEDY